MIMADELKACPLEPTIEMLVAGRKQTFADMTGEHMGPSAENTWKAMWNAAPDTRPLTGGVTEEIAAERQRQIDAEGWTPEHDDEHPHGELARAAACYASVTALPENDHRHGPFYPPPEWPWSNDWWKPGFKRDYADRRRNLVKAGALIVAEIERLDRLAMSNVSRGVK
jgi:hypothetical protein